MSESPGCSGIEKGLQSAEQQALEACVCALDSYCCEAKWDGVCVEEVTSKACGTCHGGGGGAGGGGPKPFGCCEVDTFPGCSGILAGSQTADEKAIEACVCATEPACCNESWSYGCTLHVIGSCGQCVPGAPDDAYLRISNFAFHSLVPFASPTMCLLQQGAAARAMLLAPGQTHIWRVKAGAYELGWSTGDCSKLQPGTLPLDLAPGERRWGLFLTDHQLRLLRMANQPANVSLVRVMHAHPASMSQQVEAGLSNASTLVLPLWAPLTFGEPPPSGPSDLGGLVVDEDGYLTMGGPWAGVAPTSISFAAAGQPSPLLATGNLLHSLASPTCYGPETCVFSDSALPGVNRVECFDDVGFVTSKVTHTKAP